MTSWLRLFLEPGQVTELRALRVEGHGVVSGYFDYDHLGDMAQAALELTGVADGVYFVPNPLRPEVLARSPNRAAAGVEAARDADVLARHWLLLDFDPVREARVSATDAEKELARQRMEECKKELLEYDVYGWVAGDSGNGYHLCCRIERPNDDASREWCREVLREIALRFDGQGVSVDTAVFNAARIWKLYGTTARKGTATAERPHRPSRVLEFSHENLSRAGATQ